MNYRPPEAVPPLIAHPPDASNKDAAPQPGSNGACIRKGISDKSTHLIPIPQDLYQASAETTGITADAITHHALKLRVEVLGLIVNARASGLTDAEIGSALGIRVQAVSVCRVELQKLGIVVDNGLRRVDTFGLLAPVWVAATASVIARDAHGKGGAA